MKLSMNSLDVLASSSISEIFQKWNISTIKSMQKDLEKEIIKKKDEIRVLVGEKYRDFVNVSHKIHVMNEITRETAQEIEFVSSSLNVLNTTSDVVPTKRSTTNYPIDNKTATERRRAVLKKLLIDIENQLWMEIESKQFITATALLQFAIHIRTMLNLETTKMEEERSSFVFNVWDLVLHFPLIINEVIEEELQSVDLTSSTACECFCSLALLQNLSCTDIIEKFLALRLKTLGSVLHKENSTQNVRSRFSSSFTTIVNTLEILYYCFRLASSDEGEGEYSKSLRHLKHSGSPSVFQSIDKDRISACGEIYLPSDVKNFNVKVNDLTMQMNESEICQRIGDWIQSIKECIAAHLPSYLNLINSLQSLDTLKQTVSIDDDSWMQILTYFNLKENFLIWEELYEPLVVDRAKILLSQRWNVSYARVRQKIENVFQDNADMNKREAEHDLHSFLWATDDDVSPKKSPKFVDLSSSVDLRLKVQGLSPNAGKLCEVIESLLVDITNELTSICPANDADSQKSLVLKNHQKKCCIAFVDRLINLSEEQLNIEEVCESVMLFWARFLSGIPVFCPSIKQCVLLDDKGDEWQFLTAKLSEESLNIWRKWSSRVLHPIQAKLLSFDCDLLSAAGKLKYITKWGAVQLTGENDDPSNTLNVEVRVPLQAGFLVQSIVNELAVLIGRALPPKTVLIEMRDEVVTEILNGIKRAESQPIHHVLRLQFLFDVKYLMTLLVPVENAELNERCKELSDNLEEKIDPVDLDLILPSLSSNVQLAVYNTQGIFGSLRSDKPCVSIEQYTSNSEDPSAIYLAANDIPSFPLFPISSTHSN